MKINIWQLGNDVSAKDFYDNTKKGMMYQTVGEGENETTVASYSILGMSVGANRALMFVCNAMSYSYDSIIEDQNEYLFEIDESIKDFEKSQKEIEAKIKQLEKEIEELQKKQEEGTITEEEAAELESKSEELNQLKAKSTEEADETNDKVETASEKAKDQKSKAEIATDYGETTIEKGKPLAETKDKRKSFWRKLFGTWDKSHIRELGNNMIDSGENLLEKVDTSVKLDNEINSRAKKVSK